MTAAFAHLRMAHRRHTASRRCFVGRAFFGSFSFALWTLDPSRWRRTGVSCPDAWHVGCGIIPKGSGSLKFLYRFRFISLLLKLSMGIIFLASSVSLILGWCGISFFFLNYVEYFFENFRKKMKTCRKFAVWRASMNEMWTSTRWKNTKEE